MSSWGFDALHRGDPTSASATFPMDPTPRPGVPRNWWDTDFASAVNDSWRPHVVDLRLEVDPEVLAERLRLQDVLGFIQERIQAVDPDAEMRKSVRWRDGSPSLDVLCLLSLDLHALLELEDRVLSEAIETMSPKQVRSIVVQFTRR